MDAEPEQQAESPRGRQPSAGQRAARQHAEEPETGMHKHSHTHRFVYIPHSVSMYRQSAVSSPTVTVCFHNAARKEKAS